MSGDNRVRLEGWWSRNAEREFEALAPKAAAYGSYDLELIGQVLRELINGGPVADGVSNLELGIVFYELGKVARLVSSIRDGQVPADDTWSDASIYARMVLYIREHGRWP